MKKAFTIIELIFVIVVIGILVAVVIPKLSATRDDAKISEIVYNAKTLFSDFQSYYISQGNVVWKQGTIKSLTNVLLGTDCDTPVSDVTKITPNNFVLCYEDTVCLSFITTDEGNLTINGGNGTTNVICDAVQSTLSFSNKSYQLGGNSVSR